MKCDACNSELQLVFTPDEYDGGQQYQFDNALWIEFHGGYGMFIDPCFEDHVDRIRTVGGERHTEAIQVVICHDCAHAACEKLPWLDKVLSPATSHAHLPADYDRLRSEGHRGWDLDRRFPTPEGET